MCHPIAEESGSLVGCQGCCGISHLRVNKESAGQEVRNAQTACQVLSGCAHRPKLIRVVAGAGKWPKALRQVKPRWSESGIEEVSLEHSLGEHRFTRH